MVNKASGNHETHPIRNAFNSTIEAAATLVPLVAIIAGIGMMRTLPPSNSVPLFESATKAQSFYSEIGVPWEPRIPILLSSTQCPRCDRLREDLKHAEMPFFEQNVVKSDGASRLWEATQKVTQNQTLPVVIVGTQVITPRVRSIQAAIVKADAPQK